ncbi:MAG: outer membrane beta-barrel protein [Gammaproteobacteria bacterium]
MKARVLGISLCLLGLSATQTLYAKDSGLFIGGGIGTATVQQEDTLPVNGSVDFDEDDFAWKIFGGYTLGSWFGLEGGYVNFGEADGSTQNTSDPAQTAESETWGVDAFGVVGLPLGPVRVFGKVGGIFWDSELQTGNSANPLDNVKFDEDGFDVAAGVGLEVSLFSIAVRGEAEYFNALDDILMLSLGAVWTF